MKKVIPILLCVLLISALALSVSAEGSSVALTPSKTTLERGGTFTITADLTNTEAINLCSVVLSFDTGVFELVGGTYMEGAAYGQVAMKNQYAAGTLMLGSTTQLSGKVFTFEFKVKDNVALGTYTFTPTASIGENAHIPATATSVQIVCNHSYGEWTKVDDNQHQRICSKCQTPDTEDHDWNDGDGTPSCDQASTIEYTCLICHTTKTENVDPIGHKYDNDCDSTCNNGCGTTREVSHNYVLVTDKEAHWYKCSCGELKPGSWGKHTPGPAATENSAQVCTVCNYEIAPILAHDHEISTEWYSDSESHWHRCDKKGCYHVQDKQRHVYDSNCDVVCNVCNYVRDDAPHNFKPELQANAQGHWQVCASCNAKSAVMEHVPGPEATETEPQICTECNFRIKMPLNHVHNYADTWYSDEENHWQSCGECTEITGLEAHEWDEGEEQEDGSILYTCSVCAKELTRSEPMPTEPETTPTIPESGTPKPTAPAESGGFPWQWAGIAAIVLMVVGIVLLVIEFIRSRKTNMHGRFSK